MMDIKIFVDTADDVRLVRRLTRDIKERGRTLDTVIKQYLETVRSTRGAKQGDREGGEGTHSFALPF